MITVTIKEKFILVTFYWIANIGPRAMGQWNQLPPALAIADAVGQKLPFGYVTKYPYGIIKY